MVKKDVIAAFFRAFAFFVSTFFCVLSSPIAMAVDHTPPDDYCSAFPNALQSNGAKNSFVVMQGTSFIKGKEVDEDPPFKLGFHYKHSLIEELYRNQTCQTDTRSWECSVDPSLSVKPLAGLLTPPLKEGEIFSHYGSEPKPLKKGIYTKIEVGGNREVILSEGIYTVKNLFVYKDAKLSIAPDAKVVMYVEKAEISGLINQGGNPDNFIIYGVKNDPQPSQAKPSSDYLSSSIKILMTAEVTAYIYSVGNVTLSASYGDGQSPANRPVTLKGGLTAYNVRLDSHSNIQAAGSCVKPKIYQLEIIPQQVFSLTCKALDISFYLRDEDGELVDDVNGQITISTDIPDIHQAYWYQPTDLEEKYSDAKHPTILDIVDGKGRLSLKSENYIGNINVTAQPIAPLLTNNVAGRYTFVPFQFAFSPSPISVIAGKPESVTITALACEDDDNITPATGYHGNRTLTFQTHFLQPDSRGNGEVQVGGKGQNKATLNFKHGKATFDLTYPDAGVVQLHVSDPNCSVDTGCQISPLRRKRLFPESWEQLEGALEVNARPWTFALCFDKPSDGTSSSGDGFAAAGERFNVKVRPIVWRGGSETAPIQTTDDYCAAQITQNFFKSDAPVANVALSIPSTAAVTPVNGQPGVLAGVTHKKHTNARVFRNLSWSEVGSVRLQAEAKAKYLGMTINQGYRHVGRFYPEHLEIQSNRFTYPEGHGSGANGFAYLSQPFHAQVMIKAKNAQGEQVENYNDFAADYQADVVLQAYQYPSLQSLHDRFSYHHRSSSTDRSFKGHWNREIEQVWLLKRKTVGATPLTTVEDGPWHDSNSRWGGAISTHRDPLFIRNTTTDVTDNVDHKRVAPFDHTPNLYYGRMVLSDAISLFDKPVTVPLKIEHWNGTQFVTNRKDSGSKYNSDYFCQSAIYPTDNSATLQSGKRGHVIAGEKHALAALPSDDPSSKKHQTRFWLRIADQVPMNVDCSENNKEYQPWLTYNWRELGDEDPSALVTFGLYRGSDRIVFRGEKGVN